MLQPGTQEVEPFLDLHLPLHPLGFSGSLVQGVARGPKGAKRTKSLQGAGSCML